jgi:hypothetical protein
MCRSCASANADTLANHVDDAPLTRTCAHKYRDYRFEYVQGKFGVATLVLAARS